MPSKSATAAYEQYARVLIDGGPPNPLDYGVPLETKVAAGDRVTVPMRNKTCTGTVIELTSKAEWATVKPILSVLADDSLPPDLVQLANWMSRYYNASFASILRSFLPAAVRKGKKGKEQLIVSLTKTRELTRQECVLLQAQAPLQARVIEHLLKATKGAFLTEVTEASGATRAAVMALEKKGMVALEKVMVDRSPLANADYLPTAPKKLNEEQQAALAQLKRSLDQNSFCTQLLYGVTGSGKTEVYLQAIAHALKQNKSAIVLVPEIALTAQTVERFKSRFTDGIAILHYRLSDGERLDEWRRIRRQEANIIIGARSAIFSPTPNLGLVIVDEEHDSSYKQSEGAPSYSARDLAVVRAHMNNACCVLGSATPSLESFYNCERGKYQLAKLTARADTAQLPRVTIVDMKHEYEKNKGYTLFCDQLLDGIKKRLAKGEQSLLFLNRRGYSAMQWCQQCQTPVKCPHCDQSLTFHRNDNRLTCHLCTYTQSPLRHCPTCKAQDLFKFRGVGTEQVERTIHALLPDIRTIRLDADTTRHKGSHEKLITAFRSGKADLLIGTQMVAKGLHFPQLTLVGVLGSDASINIPDFRATERVFQLLTQVAGRSGRAATRGEVIIQTAMPDNSTIRLAAAQDYDGFYAQEIDARRLFDFPPWSHLIKLTFTGENEQLVESMAKKMHAVITPRLAAPYTSLPVASAGNAKVKGRFRFQFLIKGPSVYQMHQQIDAVRPSLPKGITLSIDVDPLSTFF